MLLESLFYIKMCTKKIIRRILDLFAEAQGESQLQLRMNADWLLNHDWRIVRLNNPVTAGCKKIKLHVLLLLSNACRSSLFGWVHRPHYQVISAYAPLPTNKLKCLQFWNCLKAVNGHQNNKYESDQLRVLHQFSRQQVFADSWFFLASGPWSERPTWLYQQPICWFSLSNLRVPAAVVSVV